jgi:preprotein translocase subunit SecE
MGLLKTFSKTIQRISDTAENISKEIGVDKVVEKTSNYIEDTVKEVKDVISKKEKKE